MVDFAFPVVSALFHLFWHDLDCGCVPPSGLGKLVSHNDWLILSAKQEVAIKVGFPRLQEGGNCKEIMANLSEIVSLDVRM